MERARRTRRGPSGVVFAVVAGAVLTTASGEARAASEDGGDEVTRLEASLADETAALTTSDCANACRALQSIRRAAERICALDPGARCAAARAKADDATRRVRDACPDCAIAFGPSPTPQPEVTTVEKKGAVAPEAAPPPSESKRGGCAGCSTGAPSPSDAVGALAVLFALGRALRRRRR